MPKKFNVPLFYRSEIISKLKAIRAANDPRRKDLLPSVLDFGPVVIKIARHFGFCYGVENAIEIAYRALEESPTRRIFLLSEMIHNPEVNADLARRGVQFLMTTSGEILVPFEDLNPTDIVIVPAFGTTIEIQQELQKRGIDPYYYDTTCPFVEKVWRKSAELGAKGYTVVIHGKRSHEETRATFSHSRNQAPTVVVLNLEEAELLARAINGSLTEAEFYQHFGSAISNDFNFSRDLAKLGVVNQTTMLASETQAIAELLKAALAKRFGVDSLANHYADTKDTLCYATYENQTAVQALIETRADLGIVVGGYNSSNTSHLVELCEAHFPTFYIKDSAEIISHEVIHHYSLSDQRVIQSENWLANNSEAPLTIAITSGASCPDAAADAIILRLLSFFPGALPVEDAIANYGQKKTLRG